MSVFVGNSPTQIFVSMENPELWDLDGLRQNFTYASASNRFATL